MSPSRHAVILAATAILGMAAVGAWPGSTNPAEASESPYNWIFEIQEVRDIPRDGVENKMYAFAFDVDEDGIPGLDQAWLLRGDPPRTRPHPDSSRTYSWRLLDRNGRVLEKGQHVDRLAVYTPHPEGGCDRSLAGLHAMIIRTPWNPRATHVALDIASVRSDRQEDR